MGKYKINKTRPEKNNTGAQARNDVVVNRMMIMFVLTTIAVVGLLLIKRGTSFERRFVLNMLIYFQIASGILFAAAIIFFIFRCVKKIDDNLWIFSSRTLAVITGVIFFAFMLYTKIGNNRVVIGVIVALIISFIYSFYQRDYFWYTLFTALITVMLFVMKSPVYGVWWSDIFVYVSKILIFAVPVIVGVLFIIVKYKKGNIKIGKKNITVMKPSYWYLPFFTGAGTAVVCGALGLIFDALTIYAAVGFLGIYLIFGILYTIKMI